MTFTLSPISVKDKDGNAQSMIVYSDGTNKAFANGQLDATGAIISPATAGNQATANTALAAIQTAVEKIPSKGTATAANATPVVLATDQAALPLSTGAATSALQTTGNTSLGAIATSVANIPASPATSALQTACNTSLATIASNTNSLATATAQATGNTSLGNIDTNLGARADTAATTDGGTFSLIALLKRGLATLTAISTAAAAATPAGTNSIGTVGLNAGTNLIGSVAQAGNGVVLTNTPTVTSGSGYTTGMVVGGKLSLTGASRVNSGSGLIQQAYVTKKTTLTAAVDLLVFNSDPTNSTFTDRTALALDPADLTKLAGVIHCNDLVSCGTPQLLQAISQALEFKLSAANTTIYVVPVIRGNETFASTDAVTVNLVVIQD